MKWYIIFSGDNQFRVLKIIKTTYELAWDTANKMATDPKKDFEHYDVLGPFYSEEEMKLEIKNLKEHS